MRQCILTDSDAKGARIIGIEYMISKALFEGLDDEEKKLWHSHDYEVASGTLVAPGLPHGVANIDLADVQNTYGACHVKLHARCLSAKHLVGNSSSPPRR